MMGSQSISPSQSLTIGVVRLDSLMGNSSSSSLMTIGYFHVPEFDRGGGIGIGSGEGIGSECFRREEELDVNEGEECGGVYFRE